MNLNNHFSFLLGIPSKADMKAYEDDMNDEEKKDFNFLLLFVFFGMQQMAKDQKLVRIGDVYFTYRGIMVMAVSVIASILLNRFLLGFNYLGFALLFCIFSVLGGVYLKYLVKDIFFLYRIELWKKMLQQFEAWENRDSEDFERTLTQYIIEFPKEKHSKFTKLVRNQISH
ncbi:hypothetical protein QYF50_07220 [Paenibacillus vini]|uniref:hypothetical protein n=1 Tax=Paenibacillus vini TaxID=1476024 RepID=UPI0025B71932|nr:hypothetical protein [Paenibacillus vini]MDN4067682.1 hypothetical protein [Paenibacillus vini]